MSNSRYLKTEFFECQCSSDEHTLKFTVDEEDGTIYTNTFINDWYPWYYKIWLAIKYVFGYKSKYGHFDSFQMREEDQIRMLDLLKKSNDIRIKLHEEKELTSSSKSNTIVSKTTIAHHPV